MQVKPRFETFKILEQYPFIKDDAGNEMCLTLLEVKLPSDESEVVESTYKYWVVIGKNQHQWNNKAVSYESVAFWRAKKKEKLFKDIVQGFTIEEIESGEHRVFDNDNSGLRTVFKINRNRS
jgi:hypothetical protein